MVAPNGRVGAVVDQERAPLAPIAAAALPIGADDIATTFVGNRSRSGSTERPIPIRPA